MTPGKLYNFTNHSVNIIYCIGIESFPNPKWIEPVIIKKEQTVLYLFTDILNYKPIGVVREEMVCLVNGKLIAINPTKYFYSNEIK